jgi:hypothetical protein
MVPPCTGTVPCALASRNIQKAEEFVRRLRSIFQVVRRSGKWGRQRLGPAGSEETARNGCSESQTPLYRLGARLARTLTARRSDNN